VFNIIKMSANFFAYIVIMRPSRETHKVHSEDYTKSHKILSFFPSVYLCHRQVFLSVIGNICNATFSK